MTSLNSHADSILDPAATPENPVVLDRSKNMASIWCSYGLELALHWKPESQHVLIVVWDGIDVVSAQSVPLAKLILGLGIGQRDLKKALNW